MKVLGLTGNIACGKSAVAAMLAASGARLIETDAIVHDLYRAGTPTYEAVVRRFGQTVAGPQAIDRAALGKIVFAGHAAMAELEAIVHPAVAEEVRGQLARSGPEPAAVIEAVKMVESVNVVLLDALWIVTASRATQLRRLMASRPIDADEAARRIDFQSSPAAKAQIFAERRPGRPVTFIKNDGDLDALRRVVQAAWDEFLQLPPG